MNHAKECLIGLVGALFRELLVRSEAALGPAMRPVDGSFLVLAGVHQRGELVERKHDVSTELMLDPHRHLGREAVGVTVEVRVERDAILVDVRLALLARCDGVVVALT